MQSSPRRRRPQGSANLRRDRAPKLDASSLGRDRTQVTPAGASPCSMNCRAHSLSSAVTSNCNTETISARFRRCWLVLSARRPALRGNLPPDGASSDRVSASQGYDSNPTGLAVELGLDSGGDASTRVAEERPLFAPIAAFLGPFSLRVFRSRWRAGLRGALRQTWVSAPAWEPPVIREI